MRRLSNRLILFPGAWPTLEELREFQQSIAAPAGTFKYFGLGDLWHHNDDLGIARPPTLAADLDGRLIDRRGYPLEAVGE